MRAKTPESPSIHANAFWSALDYTFMLLNMIMYIFTFSKTSFTKMKKRTGKKPTKKRFSTTSECLKNDGTTEHTWDIKHHQIFIRGRLSSINERITAKMIARSRMYNVIKMITQMVDSLQISNLKKTLSFAIGDQQQTTKRRRAEGCHRWHQMIRYQQASTAAQ